MSGPIPFDAINRSALAILPQLLQDWFPSGNLHGHEFTVGSLAGEPGESLSINVNTGEWCDFAHSEDKGGDPISLFAALFCGKDRVKAAREFGAQLGIKVNGTATKAAPESGIRAAEETWEPIVPAPPNAPKPSDGKLGYCDALYEYRGPNHELLLYVRRTEAKGDRRKQFHPLTYGTRNGVTGGSARQPGVVLSVG